MDDEPDLRRRVGEPLDVSHLPPRTAASPTPIFDALVRAWHLGAGPWRPPPLLPEDVEEPSA